MSLLGIKITDIVLISEAVICFTYFQESPMPEPSELFTNVYVKGYGVEVIVNTLYQYIGFFFAS